jgi:hypothetical protein
MSWAENVNKMISEAERRVVSAAIDRIGNKPTGKGKWQGYDNQGNPIALDDKNQRVTSFHSFNAGLPQNTTISLDNLDVIGQQSYTPLQELAERRENEKFDDDFFLITREDGLAVIVRLRRRKDLTVKTTNEIGEEVRKEVFKRYKADAVVLSYGVARTINESTRGEPVNRDSEFNINNWASLFTNWSLAELTRDRELADTGGFPTVRGRNFINPTYIVRPWDFGVVLGNGFAGGGELPMERNGYVLSIYNQGAQNEDCSLFYDINWCYQSFAALGPELYGQRSSSQPKDNEYSDAVPLITINNTTPDISETIKTTIGINQKVTLKRLNIEYNPPPLYLADNNGYIGDVMSEKWGFYVVDQLLITSIGDNENLNPLYPNYVDGYGVNAVTYGGHDGLLDFTMEYSPIGTITTHPLDLMSQSGVIFRWEVISPWPYAFYTDTVELRAYGWSSDILVNTNSYRQDLPSNPPPPAYYKVTSRDQNPPIAVNIIYEDIWEPGWVSEDRLYPGTYPGTALVDVNIRYFVDHNGAYLPENWGFGASIVVRKPRIVGDVVGGIKKKQYFISDGSKRTAKGHAYGPGAYNGNRWDLRSIPPLYQFYEKTVDGYSDYTTEFEDTTGQEYIVQPENSFRTISFSQTGSKITDYTNGSEDLYYWPRHSFELYGQEFWIGSSSNIDGKAYRDKPYAYTEYPALWTNWRVPSPLTFVNQSVTVMCAFETQRHKDIPPTTGNENEYQYVEWLVSAYGNEYFKYGTLSEFLSDPLNGGITLFSGVFSGTEYVDSNGQPVRPVSRMYSYFAYITDLQAVIRGGEYAKARRKQAPYTQTAVHLSKEGILSILRPKEVESRPPVVWSGTEEFDEVIGKKPFQYNIFTGLKIPKHTQMEPKPSGTSYTVVEVEKQPEIVALPEAATPIVSALFLNRNLHLTASRGRFIIGEI